MCTWNNQSTNRVRVHSPSERHHVGSLATSATTLVAEVARLRKRQGAPTLSKKPRRQHDSTNRDSVLSARHERLTHPQRRHMTHAINPRRPINPTTRDSAVNSKFRPPKLRAPSQATAPADPPPAAPQSSASPTPAPGPGENLSACARSWRACRPLP